MTVSKALQRELEREYRRQHRDLAPQVRKALKATPLMPENHAIGIVVTQNVLRDCMVHVTNMALPQQREYFLELAVRLACYLITAVPLDEQEQAALVVRDGIMNKLGHMQSLGHVFNTRWDD